MKSIIKVLFFLMLSTAGLAQSKAVLPVNEFEKAIQVKGAQLLDVRTPAEYKEGYIKGAVNADWQSEKEFAAQAKKLDKTAPVYVYCLSGVRSGRAADWLAANGFKEIINLEGGIQAWKAADKKIAIK
ncbi:MAG: rhodanese-like domain-containing protein [Chitinophagaceae bacterium]